MLNRKKIVGLIFIILLVFLAACSNSGNKNGSTASSSNPSEPKQSESASNGSTGKTVVVGQRQDATTMDPHKQGSFTTMNVLLNMFDTLIGIDSNSKLAPSLATEWKAIDDYTWEFKLRQDVKFHNGEPFNAEAVKFSIDRLIDPNTKSPIAELRTVTSTEVVDEFTVRIKTSEPDPILPNKLSLFGGTVLPPQYIKEKGDDYFAQHPVGTGPFKFVSWEKDNQVVMEANKEYWGGAPAFEKLVFKAIPNSANMIAALKTGEVDIATNVTSDEAKQLEGNGNLKIVDAPSIRTFYVVLNAKEGPLADKRVRQALNLAIDRRAIIDSVLGGRASIVPAMVPAQVFGFDASVKPYDYDPEKAKALLAEAGYAGGFEINFDASDQEADIVQVISAELEQIGVKVKLNITDFSTLYGNVNAGKHAPMYYMRNTPWTMDAFNVFQLYIKIGDRLNQWENKRADELVTEYSNTTDQSKRLKAFSELQQIVKDEAPFIPLFQLNNVYAMSKETNWNPNTVGILRMHDVTKN